MDRDWGTAPAPNARSRPERAHLDADLIQPLAEFLRPRNRLSQWQSLGWIESRGEWLTAERIPVIAITSGDAQGSVAVCGDDQRRPWALHGRRKLGVPDRIVLPFARHALTAQERVEDGGMLLEPFHAFPRWPLVVAERGVGVGRTARAKSHRDTTVGNLIEGDDRAARNVG